MNIIPNAFLDNLGTDWVAIDAGGHPVCRAATEDAVRRAMPHAAAYATGADLNALSSAAGTEVLEPAAEEPTPAEEPKAEEPKAEEPKADGSAFDHDGDGKPGGGKPRTKRAAGAKNWTPTVRPD